MKFEGAVCVPLERCLSAVGNFKRDVLEPSKEIERQVELRKKSKYDSFSWWTKLWYEDYDDLHKWEYYKNGRLNCWIDNDLITDDDVATYTDYKSWVSVYRQVRNLTSVSSEPIYLNLNQAAFVDKWEDEEYEEAYINR